MKSSLVVNALAGGAVSAPLMEPTVAKRRMTLRQARLRAAKGVNELAREADVSPGTVSGIEAGTVVPRMPTIRKLASALGLLPTDIAWPKDPLELDRWEGDDDDAPKPSGDKS